MATLGDLLNKNQKKNTLGSLVQPAQTPKPSIVQKAVGFGVKTAANIVSPAASLLLKPLSSGQVGRTVTNTAREVAQGTARNIASAGVTLAKPLGGGEDFSTDDVQSNYGKKLFVKAFGDQSIRSVEDRIAEAELKIKDSPLAKKAGADKHALPLAFGGIIGSVALDLTPFGGSGKAVTKRLLKTRLPEQAFGVLKSIGIEDDIAKVFAPRFAKHTDPKAVEQDFELMQQVVGVKTMTGTTDKLVSSVADTDPLLTEARKRGYNDKNPLANIENVKRELAEEADGFRNYSSQLLAKYDGKVPQGKSLRDVITKDEATKLNSLKAQSDDAAALLRGKPTTPEDSLLAEARKAQAEGKTLEEFVRAKPVVYHGSPVPLKKFSNKKGGVFFTEEYADATGFAGTPDNVYEGYLDFKKPLVVDAKGAKWDELDTKFGKSTQEVIANAKKDGYDGVVFKNVIDNIADDAEAGIPGNIYYAYKPEESFINESQLTDIWKKAQGGSLDEVAKTREQTLLNLRHLSLTEGGEKKLLNTLESARPELEEAVGRTLTHEEVIKAAQESTILQRAVSRESTLAAEAAILKTRQNIAAMANAEGVTEDFVEQIRILKTHAADTARKLGSFGIGADPISNTTKGELVKKLIELGVETDKIIDAAKGVDFTNQKQVTEFYRKFVKATFSEKIDEYRYINLLSSPKTHIVNAFSNLIQGTLLNPATRLATGGIDLFAHALTGKARQQYMREVPHYYRGMFNSVPDAVKKFSQAMRGNLVVERPDLNRIPTNSTVLKPLQAIPRLLEASDVFFRTLITNAEKEALALRYTKKGKELTPAVLAKIEKQARETGEYYVFRKALDPANKTGQGYLLSSLDKITTAMYQMREVPVIKWFLPFIQTPMNILKQGIEYSPLGVTTLPGATNKTEQIGKTFIGSMVFLGTASLAAQGRVTWAAPSSKKERDAFYNSGRQPYSVKIGDNWVSFSKLGPLAYPMAMAAALQWYANENPKAANESTALRTLNVLNGIAKFFSDQSYVEQLGNLIELASGETRPSGVQNTVSSTVGQVIPLASLLRWTTQIVDPIYRRPDSEFNLKTIIQSVEKSIPVLSENVPRIPGSLERQNPVLNAFSPITVTNERPIYENRLQNIRREQENDARLKASEKKRSGSGATLGSLLNQ